MINVDMKDVAVTQSIKVRPVKNGWLFLISAIVFVLLAKLLLSYIDAADVPVCSNTDDISVRVAGRQHYNTYYVNCVKGDQNVHSN